MDLLLDVGCGPGTATRSVAPHFQHAIGADPGQSMIETAKSIPSQTKSGEPVTYEVCSAEELSSLSALKDFSGATTGKDGLECVDLITAATAAHWFHLPRFYVEAAKILKPGGSIIFWVPSGFFCNEETTPNAAKLQQYLKNFEAEVIAPYELPGNRHTRELYARFALPWNCIDELDTASEAEKAEVKKWTDMFVEKEYTRLEFNKDGVVQPGGKFLWGGKTPLAGLKGLLSTMSPVTRWREANKEKVASGEVEDCVDRVARETREILEEVPEGKGREWIDGGSAVVVMVMKKKKKEGGAA